MMFAYNLPVHRLIIRANRIKIRSHLFNRKIQTQTPFGIESTQMKKNDNQYMIITSDIIPFFRLD